MSMIEEIFIALGLKADGVKKGADEAEQAIKKGADNAEKAVEKSAEGAENAVKKSASSMAKAGESLGGLTVYLDFTDKFRSFVRSAVGKSGVRVHDRRKGKALFHTAERQREGVVGFGNFKP